MDVLFEVFDFDGFLLFDVGEEGVELGLLLEIFEKIFEVGETDSGQGLLAFIGLLELEGLYQEICHFFLLLPHEK